VKISTDVPDSDIVETSIDLYKTYLDSIGRTAVTLKAENLVDDLRDRELIITYDVSTLVTLRKPLLIFASVMSIYVVTWVVSKIDTRIVAK
jgi:oligosaccharyltransferase complex subunit alpha (ribophorin I)